ncbi:MAG: septum site-determining protein MinC [Idiomarina sp.]|nr:septum site-determining protein MinC [Idiomarina sp.]
MSSTPVLKGSSFTFSILQLFNNDIQQAADYLAQKISQAPSFFKFAPVVLNVEQVSGELDYVALKEVIEALEMRPIGVTGWASDTQKQRIFAAGLAALQTKSGLNDLQVPDEPEPRQHMATQVVRATVRSGQQIYAKHRDLVVLGSVSNGAEVIADGSVQIYGTLRGRAIAGANGDTDASIICHNLQAELCSIAGSYWLSDQIDEQYWQQPVLISRSDDSLQIDALKL